MNDDIRGKSEKGKDKKRRCSRDLALPSLICKGLIFHVQLLIVN